MKLYKTTYTDTVENRKATSWTASQATASADRTRLKREGFKDIKTADAEIVTNKEGILAFLNDLTK